MTRFSTPTPNSDGNERSEGETAMVFSNQLDKITGRESCNFRVPKPAMLLRSMSMSEQQSSCIAPIEKSGTVEYRTIERFPGYRFGSDGSVWSCWTKRNGMGGEWKKISPYKNRKGYLSISVRAATGQRKIALVHRLILEAFVGPCPDGCETRHFPDRDRTNNAISNLAWGTQAENMHDRELQGTWAAQGEAHKRSKLTAANVIEARELFAAGETIMSLTRRYSVDQSTLRSAVLRKTWKCLGA